MKRAFAIADRAAIPALKLIAAVNVLFLVSFLAVLLFASTRAHAEMPVCAGKDIMVELAAQDPAALAKINDEAAATLNGNGLLWKIETPGTAPSYLFGTMH